jgi:transposase
MTTTATHNGHDTTPECVLFVAFELREKTWKLGFTTGHGQKPRERSIAACNQGARDVWREVNVPSIEAEDHRPLHRALETLKQERASTTTRIKGLLRSQGIRLTRLSQFPAPLRALAAARRTLLHTRRTSISSRYGSCCILKASGSMGLGCW